MNLKGMLIGIPFLLAAFFGFTFFGSAFFGSTATTAVFFFSHLPHPLSFFKKGVFFLLSIRLSFGIVKI